MRPFYFSVFALSVNNIFLTELHLLWLCGAKPFLALQAELQRLSLPEQQKSHRLSVPRAPGFVSPSLAAADEATAGAPEGTQLAPLGQAQKHLWSYSSSSGCAQRECTSPGEAQSTGSRASTPLLSVSDKTKYILIYESC